MSFPGLNKVFSSLGTKSYAENFFSYPIYTNVMIFSIVLVISQEQCSTIPYFVHAWSIPNVKSSNLVGNILFHRKKVEA